MTLPYIITFKPIDRFFFGGSNSFAEGFFAESMRYPQPTTVLGFLRNTILIQKGIVTKPNRRVIPDITNPIAKELTGTSTINGLNDKDDNFGVIERISPVFILKNSNNCIEDILLPLPSDIGYDNNALRCLSFRKENSAISSYSGNCRKFAVLSDRNPKLTEAGCFGGKDFWEAYIGNKSLPYNSNYEEDKIFKTHLSIGIGCERKDAGGGKYYFKKIAQEKMFYSKIDYSLHKGFSFGVIAWLNDSNALKDDVMLFGGEQSAFQIKVKPVNNGIFSSHTVIDCMINGKCDFFYNLSSCSAEDKIIAMSPLVFDENINSRLKAISEHRIVKSIKAIRTIKKIGALKSEAVCIIPTGSVLYPENSIDITGWKIPYKIGYNYAIKVRR